MRSDRTRYLIMAIVALVLAIVLLRYAHSQGRAKANTVVPDIVLIISDCEQLRIQNFELKREIIRLNYAIFISTNKEVERDSAEFINSLFDRYQIDRTKFELRNGKFQPLQEKTQ